MKKTITLFLTLVILLASLNGCGNTAAESASPSHAVGSNIDAGGYDKELKEFIKAIEDGNYLDAVTEYNNNIYGNAALENEASLFLQDMLIGSVDAYNQETMSELECSNILATIQKMDDSLHIITFALTDMQEKFSLLIDSKENYEDGITFLNNGEYLNAVSSFDLVASEDMNYTSAKSYRNEAQNNYNQQVIESVEEKITAGEYETAIGIIENAEYNTGWLSEYDELLCQAYTLDAEKAISNALASGNFSSIQATYDSYKGNQYVTFSADIIEKIESAKTIYRDELVKNSIETYKSNGAKAAVDVISEGLMVLPEDEKLLKYSELYYSCLPVAIENVHALDDDCLLGPSSEDDYYGNTHEKCYYSYSGYFSNGADITYYIDGAYTKLTGQAWVEASKTNDDGSEKSSSFKILGDGIVLFDGGKLTRKDNPVTFEINVTNIKELTFASVSTEKANMHTTDTEYLARLYFEDVVLQRVLSDADLVVLSQN